VLLRRGLFRKRPRQHEFGFEQRAVALDDAVQRRSHPADHRMADPALDIPDDLSGCALVPLPIEELSPEPELHEQIAGKVFRFRLASLLSPEALQGGLVVSHNNPGIRAAVNSPSKKFERQSKLLELNSYIRMAAVPASAL
jgi:hypothetical protein